MTVSQALVTWLYTQGTISIADNIDTDQLAASASAYGLYKSPQVDIKQFINGDRDITAHYQFLVRQRSIQDTSRQNNQQWLENLERWVFEQNKARNLPALGSNRTCNSVRIANSFFAQETDEREAVYQLVIAINYTETIE